MMKSVKFTANLAVALDGVHTVAIKAGEIRQVPANIADALLKDGRAVLPEAVGYETKDTTPEVKKSKAKVKRKKKKG